MKEWKGKLSQQKKILKLKKLYLIISDEEYYTFFEPDDIPDSNNLFCEKFELPIYKEVKNNINNKIYGCLGIDIYELDDSDLTFEKRFEESNKRYINEPLLILKETLSTART